MINNQLPNHNHQINSNYQIPIFKYGRFYRLVIGFCLLFGYCNLVIGVFPIYTQEIKDIKELAKCICQVKPGEASPCLEDLKNTYFKDNKYNEFVELLKGLCPGNKEVEPYLSYYIALSRYSQLKYLEETKGWDEYFAKGNDYRDNIVNNAQKTISATSAKEALNIYAKLLLYRFHKDEQDSFSDTALADLMSAANEYAQSTNDMRAIKEVAQQFALYNEAGKSKELYKLYAQKLASGDLKDTELKNAAENFYKEGNLELAENIYNIYIERVSKSAVNEKLIAELFDLAALFAYKGEGAIDLAYAEKIYQKIEDLRGKKSFNENQMYLRGLSLEKNKAFSQTKDIYIDFLKAFPQSARAEELTYKTGIIFIYVLRNLESGRGYLEQLAQKEPVSPYTLASLYQLGLLKQWEGDSVKAVEYYNLIVTKIGISDAERLALTQERLNEIAQNKPLEYNIKIGLDTALKEEFADLDMSKISLKASSYLTQTTKEVSISSVASLGPTGCMQIELQYLWSGDLGGAKPQATQPEFQTSYHAEGTKLIILVLVSPEGITERGIDLIDVR